MDALEEKASSILFEPVRELLVKKKPCLFAVDYTDDPYYGEVTTENKEYVIRGIKKKSTTWCYRYATLYLIMGKIKLTLAACPVRNGMNHVDVLRGFLDLIASTGIPIEALLLDRGFWDSDVFFFLQKESIPYIMPVVKNGDRMRKLLSGRRSHFAPYQIIWGKRKVTLEIAVVVRYQNGRNNRHGRVHLGYAINGIDWSPQKIRKVYQRRFGIESSYRMRNVVRAKTTTKNPTIRFLYALIALVMKNIWVLLSWRYFSPVRRGPRTIARDSFSFDRFRLFVWERFVQLFGHMHRIPALRFAG
jgi:putative transposase